MHTEGEKNHEDNELISVRMRSFPRKKDVHIWTSFNQFFGLKLR